MRFNLRILFSFTLSVTAIPILATAITYYLHETPSQRLLPISTWSKIDVYIVGSRGPMFLAASEDLHTSTRVYLHLREMFCEPSISAQHLDKIRKMVEEKKESLSTTTLLLDEKWVDVANGIQACTHAVRVKVGDKTVSYPLQWGPNSIVVLVHPKYVIFPTTSTPMYVVIAMKTEEEPFIMSNLYRDYYKATETDNAGKFFFDAVLFLAFTTFATIFWFILRFSQRHALNKPADKAISSDQ